MAIHSARSNSVSKIDLRYIFISISVFLLLFNDALYAFEQFLQWYHHLLLYLCRKPKRRRNRSWQNKLHRSLNGLRSTNDSSTRHAYYFFLSWYNKSNLSVWSCINWTCDVCRWLIWWVFLGLGHFALFWVQVSGTSYTLIKPIWNWFFLNFNFFFDSGPKDIRYVYCLFYVIFVPLRWIYYRYKKWHYYLLVSSTFSPLQFLFFNL